MTKIFSFEISLLIFILFLLVDESVDKFSQSFCFHWLLRFRPQKYAVDSLNRSSPAAFTLSETTHTERHPKIKKRAKVTSPEVFVTLPKATAKCLTPINKVKSRYASGRVAQSWHFPFCARTNKSIKRGLLQKNRKDSTHKHDEECSPCFGAQLPFMSRPGESRWW